MVRSNFEHCSDVCRPCMQDTFGSVHILRHLPRGGGGGFQKMTLDEGGGVYGQMTSSKIAQFRDFLYLKKLLAVSVYCDNVEI